MNGLTVMRTTRSPNSFRTRFFPPGKADDASASSVGIPRSQFWQMVRHTSPIPGCDSEDCSDSRPSNDSRTASCSSCGSSLSAILLDTNPSRSLRTSWPISETSDRHCPESSRST